MKGLLYHAVLLLLASVVQGFSVLKPPSTSIRLFPTTSRRPLAATSTSHDTTTLSKIPIHLLAGFLGSGKTTTLKHLLENVEDTKIGVVVNDVASVNIDAKLVSKKADNGVMELQNGCACCSLADELLVSLENLLKSGDFDVVLVELSGVADPVAIQNNWKQAVKTRSNVLVTDTASLENIITLVDACTFGTDYLSWNAAKDQWTQQESSQDCSGNRKVAELLTEQVEAADLVILNKQDLASTSELDIAKNMIQSLNKDARLVTTSHGKVSASQILQLTEQNMNAEVPCDDTDCTDSSHSHSHDHDASSCDDPDCTDNSHSHSHDHATSCDDPDCTDNSHSHSHDHEASCDDPDCTDTSHSHSHDHASTNVDSLGISSFVYKAIRPFNAERLSEILFAWPVPNKDELDVNLLKDGYSDEQTNKSPFVGVLRSKGFCWIAPTAWEGVLQDAWRHNQVMYWSHAGKHLGVQQAGRWWDSVDRETMKEFFADNPSEYERVLEQDFVSKEFGDRRQELVFIGVDLQESKIREALDACLLNEDEMKAYRKQVAKLQQAQQQAVEA